jgi:hypothetical protein
VGEWIILKWILEIGGGGMYWIDLAQDKDEWRALVNAVMNLRIPYSYTTDGFSRRTDVHGICYFCRVVLGNERPSSCS